jgi:hypothetical protein
MESTSPKSDAKKCSDCKEVKPLSGFHKNRRHADGLCNLCKVCNGSRAKAWNAKNPDRMRDRQRSYAAKNSDKIKASAAKWAEQNRERRRAIVRKHCAKVRPKLRAAAFAAYGGPVCVCCAEREVALLTIDHVNNDGAAHRKLIGSTLDRWLKKNGYPPGFQVLCRNCNWGKHVNNGICPHQACKPEPFVFVG